MLDDYYRRLEDISKDSSKTGWDNLKELFNDVKGIRESGIEDLKDKIEEEFNKKKKERAQKIEEQNREIIGINQKNKFS